MPLRYLDDSGYNAGMIRDQPSWLLPSGAVYDQLNVLNDVSGIARQRGATTALVSGSQTAFATSIGWCYSQDATPIEQLYGANGKTGIVSAINASTGAATSLGAGTITIGTVGRPIRHFGFVDFPVLGSASGSRASAAFAGQASTTTFANTANSTIAAGNQQITLTGGDATTNIKVGSVVVADTAGNTNIYYGRVVSIDSATKFTVWPTPTVSFTSTAGGLSTGPGHNDLGGTCGASFQNRLLFGNVVDLSSTSQTLIADRRVAYSLLPTERGVFGGSKIVDGATFLAMASWPVLNYFTVPGADPIVAMEPISDGELLILTNTSVIIFQGNLVTELATTSPSITYDIYPLGVTEGCASDLSVQRTPVGIMWAGAEGVFAYWPPLRRSPAKTGIRNLCEGKILKYWLSLSGRSDFVVHGAAYTRDHYIVSGFANGATFSLMVNLNNNQWTRLSGAGTDIFNGVRRPTIPSQTFAARWWDQTGAAPSMTNGQTVRLETMLDQYTAGTTKTDSDGTAVPISITTRTIGGDTETQKLFQRGTVRHQQASTTAAVAVTAQSTIDAADIDASRTRALGSLSNTATLTLSNATNANPIVCTTTVAHGLQSDDFVDIDAVLGNLNANGRWRISVLSTTTFSLVGGIGNAAYVSGGKVKKLTETDFTMSSLNAGQGASVTVAGSPNNFELHGVRLALLERPPVMST